MKLLSYVTLIIGWLWIIAAGVSISIGLIGILMKEGFWAMTRALSPLNPIGFGAVVITLAPGIILVVISEWLKKKT